jgi:hypothetical protein
MPTPVIQKILSNQVKTNTELVKSAGGVLYLDARKATGFGLPTNSPLTSQFIDLTGNNNNATLNNFDGTSGWNTSSSLTPYLNFDGINDRCNLPNNSSLDITTNEFALAATFRVKSTESNAWILSRNLSTSTVQYGLHYYGAANNIGVSLNSLSQRSSINVSINIWYNVIFYRSSAGVIYPFLNNIAQSTVNYATALTSMPNTTIGARSTNDLGTAFTANLLFDLGTLTIYHAPKLNITNIRNAEKQISKSYIST